ncbi:MAG: hypothetical protein AUJ12_07915 [Alphaproteobacteria bacterium CG1_02_46_17]|nr:MAG: hypothetical protein AUJ12_07915 [Alphaproteobacteria bacterium CG1_02_46_17]
MKSYPLFKVHVPVEDALVGIREVLESGFINEGLQVTQFQNALKEHLGVTNLVVVNSCTSALTMAYKICGVGPDTEVITTAMTCIATNTPIDNLGAKIVWADIDANTGSIDPKDIERKITPKTKAIVIVSWAGTPCDLEAVADVAKRHNIPVVQDAAHAFDSRWNGRPVSEFSDFTCYSFQAIKHLSSGDGGALICRDEKDFELARKLKWFGYDRDAHKDEKGEWKGQRWSADIFPGEVGYKFNMNNVAAAIGLAQMPYIGKLIDAHRANAAVYQKCFANSNVIHSLDVPSQATSSFWVFTALVNDPQIDRDLLLEALNQEGIAAGLVHMPNDSYSAFKESLTDLPETHKFASTQISLPCGWWLGAEDCEHIATRVLELCEKALRNAA